MLYFLVVSKKSTTFAVAFEKRVSNILRKDGGVVDRGGLENR